MILCVHSTVDGLLRTVYLHHYKIIERLWESNE